MPRVYTKTKSDRGFKVYVCSGCNKPVEPGQQYYTWSRRFGGRGKGVDYYRHVSCGYPRPTQLSSAKTAVVEEAVQDVQKEMGEFHGGMNELVGGIAGMLSSVAETAREVAEEYRDGVNNMPDSLQYSPTADAMNSTADELESWADNLDSWEYDQAEFEWDPDPEDEDADRESAEDEWRESVRSSADDILSEMPYYQG